MNPYEVDGTGCTSIVLVFVDEKQWLYLAPEWVAGAESVADAALCCSSLVLSYVLSD